VKPDDFRRLVAAGLNSDQVALVMEMFDERDETRKAGQRARWRKHQENKKNANVSQREQTLANVPREGVARVEDKSLPQKIEPQTENKKDALRDVEEFKAELSSHLSPEQLAGIIKLRRQKHAVINGHAARLFVGAVGRCGISLSEAADKCIERNWLSIEPGWLSKGQTRAPPSVQRSSPAQHFRDFASELNGQERDDRGVSRDWHDAAGVPIRTIEHHRG
jgi:hypothetical protein